MNSNASVNDHLAYQWLCGGVSVNYHMLADFRSQGGDKWDELLTQIVATLMAEDLVTMERVAQDGMKVRADAGKSSFRRAGRLEELLEEARAAGRDAQTTGRDQSRRTDATATRGARARGQGPSSADRGSDPSMRRVAERTRGKRQGRAAASRPRRGRRPPIPRRGS